MKHALVEHNYQLIKQHIVDPENTRLSSEMQFQLDRLLSAAKLLDKNPIKKHAVALHRRKFPSINTATAYRDLNEAARLYSTFHDFDWDFWQGWILKDITDNINKCRATNTSQDRKIIAQEHANLLKAIGDKPSDIEDPTRHEKHQYFIMVQLGKDKVTVDLEKLKAAPGTTIKELNKLLFSGHDIDDVEAEEIMNS
ncbi:MAG: hypothetical protein HQ522_15455 [Bacteroidetes bacterium]|nr:hypothetical protein [Bacteroidota bacterium]